MQPITEYIPGFTDLVVKNSAVFGPEFKSLFYLCPAFCECPYKNRVHYWLLRRNGRVVECGGLENR